MFIFYPLVYLTFSHLCHLCLEGSAPPPPPSERLYVDDVALAEGIKATPSFLMKDDYCSIHSKFQLFIGIF
jgi:hypothetical protein